MNQIECKQRMSQVVKNAEEQNEIKSLPELVEIINGKLLKLDLYSEHFCGEASLIEIALIRINREDSIRASSLHFDTVEPTIASDIQDCLALQVIRDGVSEPTPLQTWIIS